MSFDNLPDTWPTIPLTDPDHIADVLDMVVSLEARRRGALVAIICDDQRRPVQPIQIDDIPACPPAEARTFLRHLADAIGGMPGGCALFAIASPRTLRVSADDQAWRHTIEAAFEATAEVIGVHVVTVDGSLPVVASGAAA